MSTSQATPNGSPPAAGQDEDKRRRRWLLLLLLLLLLVPICLWIVAQLALLELGMNEAHESVLSQLRATYAPWAPSNFGPLDPTMIGTIRAEQATFAAGGNGIGILVPFISGGGAQTQIAANASATPTAAVPTGTGTPPTQITTTPIIIYYPGTATVPSGPPVTEAATTTPGAPAATDTLPPPPPPTRTPVPGTADLAISKDDGTTTYTPGGSTTYTIVVTNNGPLDVNNARVQDTFPAEITGVTWTCSATAGSSCPAGGSGNINVTVNLLNLGSATFTVTANISPAATGSLVNTATVTPPANRTDPFIGDNSASDTDASIVTSVDLSITKDDGITIYTPGSTVNYMIIASNGGPATATNATVTDNFLAPITSATWTCTATAGSSCPAPASGSGNINASVTLLSGGQATFSVFAVTNPAATVNLANTATIAPPGGVVDSSTGNDSATDTDTRAYVDLAISKTDGKTTALRGHNVTYTIVVTNGGTVGTGPGTATVTDTLPAQFIAPINWTCTPSGGASSSACPASGATTLNDTVSVPLTGSITYTVTARLNPAATVGASLANTATVTYAGDNNTADNTATDTDTVSDVTITLTWTSTTARSDLDLWVVDPTGVIHSPYNGASDPDSPAGGTLSGRDWSCTVNSSDPFPDLAIPSVPYAVSEIATWTDTSVRPPPLPPPPPNPFPPSGTYRVYVFYNSTCAADPGTGNVDWQVSLTMDGTTTVVASNTISATISAPGVFPFNNCPGILLLSGGGTSVPPCPVPALPWPGPYTVPPFDPTTTTANYTFVVP